MQKSYGLVFSGYWRDVNVGGLPTHSGVYGVYAATYNATDQTVDLKRLIYIGESENVQTRVLGHEKWPLWRQQLRLGELLCFNTAPVSPTVDRCRAEAAMIYGHKPVCNGEYVNHFPFDTTLITTSGRNALMKTQFTVYKTQATVLTERW